MGIIGSGKGKIILRVVVLYFIFSGVYLTVSRVDVQNPSTAPGGGTDPAADLAPTAHVLNAQPLVGANVENMSLAQLKTLSFDSNSTSCPGLLDSQYWSTVFAASGSTVVHLIPNTVYGLQQSVNEWTAFYEENMSDPPWWVNYGASGYVRDLEARLGAEILGTHNMTLAVAEEKNFTAYASGLSLTGLDFLTWGGVSGLVTYLRTGDPTQAAESTFPGQIYELFSLSQDCSFPEQQRATFFGQALAATLLVVATSGKDGFDPQFEGLLTKLNLLDVWSQIKGYLGDIGGVSPASAYETTMVLDELGERFPATFDEVAPFTTDRIDLMIEALKEKGLTTDQINEKLSELAQFAKGAAGDGDVAERADEIAYEESGTIMAGVDSNMHLILYGGGATARYIQETFLEKEIPGFVASTNLAFKITVHKEGDIAVSYYVYQGGQTFSPTLPEGQANPGDVVPISIDALPLAAFLKNLPPFQLTNKEYVSWVADSVVVKDLTLEGNTIQIHVSQVNTFSSTKDFTITGTVQKYPGSSTNYGGAYVEFTVTDYAGRTQTFRLRSDGYDTPTLQYLTRGGSPYAVSLVSYDGLRLSIVYSKDNKVVTMYLVPPSTDIYTLGDMRIYSGPYLNKISQSYSNAYIIDSIETVRPEETEMLIHGSTYDIGRLGAEIAYVIATDKLGLRDVILQEPSVGGRDLYTRDNTVTIQARLLVNVPAADPAKTIQKELFDLVSKLTEDYQNQKGMIDGYAILSYIDPTDGVLKSIVVEVPPR